MKASTRLFARLLLVGMVMILGCQVSQAQFFKKLKRKVKQAVEQTATDRAANDASTATDSTISRSERAVGHAIKNVKGDSKSDANSTRQGTNGANGGTDQAQQTGTNQDSNNTSVQNTAAVPPMQLYKNYDFVPGDTVIFQSQLADEQVGEIPSQFTLTDGQMDVQKDNGKNVIHITKGPGAVFTPRMTNTAYMPDQFTVEFDFKNESFGLNHIDVDFGHRVYYSGGEGITPGMSFGNDMITWTLGDVHYPDGLNLDNPMQWHHIAIAINKNVGKVYIDQFRVVNVNNLTGKPNNVTFAVAGYENSFIKNISIAAGGIDIYKEVTTASKITTHGILFDLDQATIKPESMGTINKIFRVLEKDPSLKFEIDGHTDNTGDANHNLTLSQQRADAVKTQLVSMGIDTSRLTTKGFGDTKPISSNNTPEGRANNRRVEFVKI